MRTALYNAFAQSDVSGRDPAANSGAGQSYYLRDWAGIDLPQGGTVYVDGSLSSEMGKINSTMAFKTIALAVQLSPAGTTIIVRPGTYTFDEPILVQRSGIRLIGYGVKITPETAGADSGFAIAGNFCVVEGFEIDGGIVPGAAVDSDGGLIQVGGASNVTLRNLYLHDSNLHGIYLPGQFPNVKIDNVKISGCNTGITCPGVITATITSITIKNCPISSNRNEGIKLAGVDNAGGIVLKDIRIQDNEIISNDSAGLSKSAISLPNGAQSLVIQGNYLFDHYNGIYVGKVKRMHLNDNLIEGMRNAAIEINGWQIINICDNTIGGENQNNNNPLTVKGVYLHGDYDAANDSAVAKISGNTFNQIASSGYSINCDHGSNIKVVGNHCRGPAGNLFTACQDVRYEVNTVNITTGNNIPLMFAQGDRATTGVTDIISNGLFSAGAPTRLIATDNPNSLTMDTFMITSNAATPGKTYSGGIISHVSGTAPTVYKMGNSPIATTVLAGAYNSQSGFVNDGMTLLGSKELDIVRGTAIEKVIGARKPGWGVPTGTLDRTTFATHDPITISNPPTQAEIQAVDAYLSELSQRLAALINDVHSGGANTPTHALLTLT